MDKHPQTDTHTREVKTPALLLGPVTEGVGVKGGLD